MANRFRELFKDKEHLVRMAGIFAVGIVAFFLLQRFLVPDTFGRYGHYRGAAVTEAQRASLVFAGRASCERCHAEQATVQKTGPHAKLGCEACHGALRKHADSPTTVEAQKPDTKTLCPVCHAANVARPAWLEQVDVQEHASGEACGTCHQPHDPRM